MSKVALVVLMTVMPAVALAQLAVDIVSPAQGTCVNNGDEVFTGGFFGGELIPPPRDVPVVLDISGHGGNPVDVVIEVDGFEAVIDTFFPVDANDTETDGFPIPSFFIQDGQDAGFTVRVSQDAGAPVQDQVGFELDREPPILRVDLDELPDLQQCYQQQPDVDYTVFEDGIEGLADVDLSDETVTNGCEVSRVVTLRDECNNAQEVRLNTLRPSPQAIQVDVQAFRCSLDDCLVEGEDAQPVEPGTRVGAATANFSAVGEPSCVFGLEARYFLDEDPPDELEPGDGSILVPGDRLSAPGTYTIVAIATTCNDVQVRGETTVIVLDRPVADPGGVDESGEGDPENAPTHHTYRVTQGEPLELDGSGSSAAPELGGITRWEWDLDLDGQNEFDGANIPRVPYDSAIGDGVNLGLLSITAGNGGVARQAFRVIVEDVLPTCDAGGPYEGVEGERVEFDGSGSRPGHETDPLIAYDWDFGDGLFPQRGFDLTNPGHSFPDSGQFQVTLIVEDVDSPSAPCLAQATIADVSPIVEGLIAFGANDLQEGDFVSFSAGTTRAGSAADPIQEYCWDFGDGSPEECGAALLGPTHQFVSSGDFTVCLRVHDEEPDDTAEGCIDISVGDVDPFIERIDGPALATEGDTVEFEAFGILAGGPFDNVRELVWDFGDGNVERVDLEAFPGRTRIAHTFNDDSISDDGDDDNDFFTVTATVFDQDSQSRVVSTRIRVTDVGPVAMARALFPGDDRQALEGIELGLSAEGSAPGNESDPIVEYRWDFGDGERGEGPEVQHAWPDAGTYQVRLTVVDEDGSQAVANLTINVANVAPRIFIEARANQLEIGEEMNFRLVVQDVPADRPPPSIEWEMGDGTTYSNRTAVTHAYDALGDKTVRVRVDHPGEADEAAEATYALVVTPAAPRFTLLAPEQDIEAPIQAREGEPLAIRVQVDSAALGEGRFDGEVITVPSLLPEGAVFAEDIGGPDNDRRARKWIDITWTPTFYQSGEHTIRIRALAPVTNTPRDLNIQVNVTEAGSPLLAALGTDGADGRVNLYRYGLENGAVTFDRFGSVNIGIGARGLAYDQRNGQRVFAGVPSAGVAVVNTTNGPPSLQRVIPTGQGTAAVIWGDDLLWALNADDRTIAIIDPETLKIDRTVDLVGVSRPYDMAWLPAGFDGQANAHIVIVDALSGEAILLDPEALQDGDAGEVARADLGGSLDRVVADPDTGWLNISDRKTRRVYQVSVDDLAGGDPGVQGVDTGFRARDIGVAGGTAYVATDAGVWTIGDDGRPSPPADSTRVASAITALPEAFVASGGLIIGEDDRVYNYNPDFDRLADAPGSRMRRLTAFVALED